jgi:hypothetical protein
LENIYQGVCSFSKGSILMIHGLIDVTIGFVLSVIVMLPLSVGSDIFSISH